MHQKLIHTVLARYDLDRADVQVIRASPSLVARVRTDGGAYALRIRHPDVTAERVGEEVAWLLALRRDTDLLVPTPVPNGEGAFVTPLEDPVSGRERQGALFTWVEGEPVGRCTSAAAEATGAMLARLHRHAATYDRAGRGAFVGPRYDAEWLAGPRSWWGDGRARADLGAERYERLAPAVGPAARTMRALGDEPKHFGIIHADLHPNNVVFDGRRYGAIDFGDCALGHYGFDLAVAEVWYHHREECTRYVSLLREEYQRERGAPLVRRELDAFTVAAGMRILLWAFTGTDPSERARWRLKVPITIERLALCGETARHASK